MAEGPSEGVQVDEDDADDAASWSAAYIAVGCARVAEADVKSEVEHGCALDSRTDQERETASDAAMHC